MRLVLTLDHRRGVGTRETRTLGSGTLSIGRGPGNDWVLADPDRHLSKTHCMVSGSGGRFELTDVSTNGVFVNGAREPLGRDVKVSLTDGDDFRIGDYVISVTELAGEAPALPPAARGAADPLGGDVLDDPFAGPPHPRPSGFPYPAAQTTPPVRMADPFDLADEHQHGRVSPDENWFAGPAPADPWQGPSQPDHADAPFQAFAAPRPMPPAALDDLDFDALLGDVPPGQPAPLPPAQAAMTAANAAAAPVRAAQPQAAPEWTIGPSYGASPMPAAAPPVARAPVAQVPSARAPDGTPVAAGAELGLAAFLEGCGVPELRRGGRDAEATLRLAGTVMRVMVEGLRDVLMSRSAIKNELRVEQTMLRSRDNNALKFSVTAEEALAALLLPNRPGYKPPLDAAREAFDDIRSHEMAVMAGVQTALIGLLKRFDPAALEQRLQRGTLDSFLPGARKARYWELFCTTYSDIAREAEDDFQSVFGREFAKAYAAQMKKL
jgi:type VI secretion system FHA domain protein